jgi:hypothetical protein
MHEPVTTSCEAFLDPKVFELMDACLQAQHTVGMQHHLELQHSNQWSATKQLPKNIGGN